MTKIAQAVLCFRANRARRCLANDLPEISTKFEPRRCSGCRDIRHLLQALRFGSETQMSCDTEMPRMSRITDDALDAHGVLRAHVGPCGSKTSASRKYS